MAVVVARNFQFISYSFPRDCVLMSSGVTVALIELCVRELFHFLLRYY